MREIFMPWAKRSIEDAMTGLDGADLRLMMSDEDLKKVDEVRKILMEYRNILYAPDDCHVARGDFLYYDPTR